MGYGFMPYAVDLDAARRAFGSKDEPLIAAVIASQDLPDDDTDEDDVEFDEDDDDDDDDDTDDEEELVVPSSQEALRHIVMGEPFARGLGAKYGYVFKSLVEHLGRMLPNDQWERGGGEFIERFDGVLDRLKVPADLFRVETHLMARHDPVPLPRRHDFPSIGHLTAAEVKAVVAALAALDPAAVRAAATGLKVRRGTVDPADVVACLDEIVGWCRTCAADGKALVTFYH